MPLLICCCLPKSRRIWEWKAQANRTRSQPSVLYLHASSHFRSPPIIVQASQPKQYIQYATGSCITLTLLSFSRSNSRIQSTTTCSITSQHKSQLHSARTSDSSQNGPKNSKCISSSLQCTSSTCFSASCTALLTSQLSPKSLGTKACPLIPPAFVELNVLVPPSLEERFPSRKESTSWDIDCPTELLSCCEKHWASANDEDSFGRRARHVPEDAAILGCQGPASTCMLESCSIEVWISSVGSTRARNLLDAAFCMHR
jgi:hypothetical protein